MFFVAELRDDVVGAQMTKLLSVVSQPANTGWSPGIGPLIEWIPNGSVRRFYYLAAQRLKDAATAAALTRRPPRPPRPRRRLVWLTFT